MFTVPIKNMILLIIGLRGETHGYEILKEIEKIAWGYGSRVTGTSTPCSTKWSRRAL